MLFRSQEELDAYNPLIPDGSNWKATFMLEYDDPSERAERLAEMVGIEDTVWLQVADCDKVYPIADEDLDRTTEEKTSSVHFMRYELSPSMVSALQQGAALAAGVDHPAYPVQIDKVPAGIRDSLTEDLDPVSVN